MDTMKENLYKHLLMMTIASFAAMYVLMYAMVDAIGNIYSNLSQVYMAALMTAAMVVIELFVMRGMYSDRRRNAIIVGASVAAGIASFVFIQQQTGISNRQFLRSRIPHHAAASLMCEEADVSDPEIRTCVAR